MASQGKHGQALGLAYSVLEPHVVLAAGVSGSLLSECLCMCKSVIAKNFEPHHHHHHHHDSLLAFGEMQTQRKLHKDSLAGRSTSLATESWQGCAQKPASHSLCQHKRELINKVRVRGPRAPGRTEDAGLRLWSKVPDKRLTNKALSPGTRLASRTWGRRREKERGPSQMQPCAPQGGRIWEHSYCKWTGLRLMGWEGHLAVPICPEPRGPGWVVCVFHISINPICFIYFFRLLFTLLKIYFHMEQKSAPDSGLPNCPEERGSDAWTWWTAGSAVSSVQFPERAESHLLSA